jgi:hypothetical protein
MRRNSDSPAGRGLAAALILSAAMLALGIAMLPALDLAAVARRLLLPLLRLLASILIGLALGELLEASGWTRHLAALAGPLFRFGRLGPLCSAAFTTAFLSGVSSNAMLFDLYQDGRIDRRQLFLTNFVNQTPAFFLHLPTTFFIIVPLTGWAGLIYLAITLAAALLRTAVILLYGRLRLPLPAAADDNGAGSPGTSRRHRLGEAWRALRGKLPGRFTRIARFVVPIYTAVFLLNGAGLFQRLQELVTGSAARAFLPVEALSVVALSFAAEFASGFAAAGALQSAGVLSLQQTVIALLLGNIVAFPLRALRHQLPRYLGIFAPAMGTQLLLGGQALRIASLLLVGGAYYWLG